jgi:hypothetical protein
MEEARVAVVVLTLETLVVDVLGSTAVDVPVCVPNMGVVNAPIELEADDETELIPDPDCFTTVKV